jgi:predicted aldo/keto reductase-like oxidoreductase
MKNENTGMNRRTFLRNTGVGGAAVALSAGIAGNLIAAEGTKSSAKSVVPTRTFGKSGVPVSMLSFGGIDWTVNQNLLRMGLNMGVTFWDTADNYQNGKTDIGIGQYLEKKPEDREKLFICTKAMMKDTPEQFSASLDTSLQNMKTDYVDAFLYHNVNSPDKLTPEIQKWAEQKKKEGKIKLFGFSTHSKSEEILKHAASLGWIDAIMLTYNYVLMNKDEMKRGVDACAKAGIGLIAIKSQAKIPDITETPEELGALNHFMEKGCTLEQAKLKAVWSDERIATICSNITNLTILKDNVAAATDNVSLSSRDFEVLNRLAAATCRHYCQGCGKCMAAMENKAPISDIMRYMMYYNSYGNRDLARSLYGRLPGKLRASLSSMDFTPAESVCPHGMKVGSIMRKASTLLV